jgi:hypothetical protein
MPGVSLQITDSNFPVTTLWSEKREYISTAAAAEGAATVANRLCLLLAYSVYPKVGGSVLFHILGTLQPQYSYNA